MNAAIFRFFFYSST
ncbi:MULTISPECIES: pheST operon leader peptide PheM [Enterobacteriaceae]|uniref:pheST attenuator peptide n=1 Tax=Escherichia marmotae TaxID=1499973 RepID=A0ABU1BXC1_9ESCH|nr:MULTISPECIES: pheST operon leader peptide PheM [Enterobacteriaceae]MBE1767593.1 pheST operon leader peptide PheM [Escherichia marmotae]MCE5353708.1 pheST operon leader peptide PheM [Escherichia marmotae]MCE5383210.1 pheST operon leader peptide PheM [Escherichia marmotae]MDQ9211553.1 pheST operon leader peptide PheM [Escherichia marmotae]MDQ9226839.1 pheST operon leader peptide PheM [Escherichia marmotae]